jgi:peptide/nickel transport system substrate-binding protein
MPNDNDPRATYRVNRLTRRGFLGLTIGASAVAVAACAQPAAPSPTAAPKPVATTAPAPAATKAPAATIASGQPKTGGTFTMGRVSAVDEFNPVNLTSGHVPFLRSIWNSLGRYDANLTLQPDLAEKWDFSADGKKLTLKLRQGVKWHSGREFTSDDVKVSVNFGQTADRSLLKALYSSVKSVDTPDKYTAVMNFDSVNPGAFDILDTLYMVDKETIEQRSNQAIGTGPFKLDKFIPGDRVELVPNKDYYEGAPYLDRYIVRQIPDAAALAINLESGAVDCIYNAPFVEVVRLQGAGGKWVVNQGAPSAQVYDIAMNTQMPPFDNKKVRQAISFAIDRDRFCKTVLRGLSEPTTLMYPKFSWAYPKDLEGTNAYNMDKAAALLKEAGFANGFSTELVASTQAVPGSGDLAQMLQADLAKLSIKATINDVESAQYNSRTQTKRDVPLMTHSWGRSGRDPGSMLTGAKAWYTDAEGGWTRFTNPQYEQLRKDLQATLDRDKRVQLCRQIQILILDEVPMAPVGPVPMMFIHASYLKGFANDRDNSLYTAKMWLDK